MKKEKIVAFFKNRTVKILLIAAAALCLLLCIWKVFFSSAGTPTPYEATAREERLSNLLSQIEGVRSATVMISESEGETVGAVIVFDGADSILTRMRVLDAASALLGIKKELILVYPS